MLPGETHHETAIVHCRLSITKLTDLGRDVILPSGMSTSCLAVDGAFVMNCMSLAENEFARVLGALQRTPIHSISLQLRNIYDLPHDESIWSASVEFVKRFRRYRKTDTR